MNTGYQVKNADDMQKLDATPPESKIIEEVSNQINALKDNSKENYEELNKRHEQLKTIIDGLEGKYVDAGQLETIKKLTDDISTRQVAIDEGMGKRMDDIEVAMQRVGNSDINMNDPIEIKDVHDFLINAAVVNSRGKGIVTEEVDRIRENASVEEYKAYTKAFNAFLRNQDSPRVLTPDQSKALSVGVDPDGGYTVTPAMSARIIKKKFERSPLRELAAVETISTGAIEWMVDWDQAGYGWEEETVAGAQTDTPQFYKKRIPVHVLYAKPRASQVLLEDSGINIEAWLANHVADRFARIEGNAFVTGDGIGKPRGFLDYSTTATADSWGYVNQHNMGVSGAVNADGFITVKYALSEYYLNRGTWLMSRATVAATMKLKDGNGNYIWSPGMTNDNTSTILGLPVRMATDMPTIAADSLSVALGDWKEAYMIVDRLGITMQRDPFTVKPMIEFYTRARVGGSVVNYQALKIGKLAA